MESCGEGKPGAKRKDQLGELEILVGRIPLPNALSALWNDLTQMEPISPKGRSHSDARLPREEVPASSLQAKYCLSIINVQEKVTTVYL